MSTLCVTLKKSQDMNCQLGVETGNYMVISEFKLDKYTVKGQQSMN